VTTFCEEEIELFYDDGSAEWKITEIGSREGFTIRCVMFTPLYEPAKIVKLKFYISNGSLAPFIVLVFNESWSILYQGVFIPEHTGWCTLNLYNNSILVSGEFIVGMRLLENLTDPLGVDCSSPDYKSFDLLPDGKVITARIPGVGFVDYMIRVVLNFEVDSDGDGLQDYVELKYGTCLFMPDSDLDGLTDGEEILVYGTNPLNADTDGDGLTDSLEIEVGINPLRVDSDGDELGDKYEFKIGTNPLSPDSDHDLLLDGEEVKIGTNPLRVDSDGDGLDDYEEVRNNLNPNSIDSDGDFWIDSIDLYPRNSLAPNIIIFMGLAMLIFTILYISGKLRNVASLLR